MIPLEAEEQLEMAQMERELPVASIIAFRTLAQNELDRESEKFGERQSSEPASASWFSYLYSTGVGQVAANTPSGGSSDLMADIEVTAEERQRLQQALTETQQRYEVCPMRMPQALLYCSASVDAG